MHSRHRETTEFRDIFCKWYCDDFEAVMRATDENLHSQNRPAIRVVVTEKQRSSAIFSVSGILMIFKLFCSQLMRLVLFSGDQLKAPEKP
jgi:hypothetical protein